MAERLRQLARDAIRARRIGSDRGRSETGATCRKLLAELRKRCPDLIPPDPLKSGKVGPEIPVDVRTAGNLLRAAIRPERGEAILWQEGDNALVVHTAKVSAQFGDGQVVVSIPVACDQRRSAVVRVPFVLGSAERPAGMLAATQTRPAGPAAVVEIWGEALTALAWQALLATAAAVAGETGRDQDGAGLIPAAMAATANGLTVLTMARHEFDRAPPGPTRGGRR